LIPHPASRLSRDGEFPYAAAAKRAAIDRVWRSVAWPDPPHPHDAFHAVLGEIGRKKRLMRASSLTMWYD